jgi:hypothetical protein
MTRVALLGDIGGQYEVFKSSLRQLGCNPESGYLPPDLVVIQVGDLIRVGSSPNLDSSSCIELADRMLRNSPRQWIQLIGNHDAALLGGPRMRTWADEPPVSDIASALVKGWWHDRRISLAAALEDERLGSIFVSHAGLTRSYWQRMGATTAVETAQAINELVGSDLSETSHPGKLITGITDINADVLWAEVNEEVYSSWIGHAVPFNQVHGHDAPWDWAYGGFLPSASQEIRERCIVDTNKRRTITALGADAREGPVAISVDWNLGTSKWEQIWDVLVLEASVTEG